MNNIKTIICIDPGKSGAIVAEWQGKIQCHKMPDTPKDIYDILSIYHPFIGQTDNTATCYLEFVHGMPGQGGQAMFTFGKGYGWLEMALLALEIPTITITPQKWQKPLSLGTQTSCLSKQEWKNKLKAKTQQLFPSIPIELWNADALLMLHYVKTYAL